MGEKNPFLRSLEVFLAVLSERSFSGAARRLKLSQPTVTLRIQSLEQALGVELFERGPKKVEPTAAGAALTVYAERLLAVRDEMLEQLQGVVTLKRGTLRIAASTTPGNYVMASVLQQFNQRYAGLRVVMDVADSDRVVDLLREGTVEIAVTGGDVRDSSLHAEPFMDDEIVVVAPVGHPAVASPELPLNGIVTYTWVVREAGSATSRLVSELVSRASDRARLRIAMVLGSTEAIKMAVRAGAGIALVSHRAVQNEVALGKLGISRIASHPLRRSFYAVKSNLRTLSPAATELWSFLLGAARIAKSASE